MYKVSLSARGQVVIPADLRKKLGLRPGMSLAVHDSGNKIIFIPEMEDPVGQGLGFLRRLQPHEKTGEEEIGTGHVE
ncbi:MAG TPA: AbrB/MazE/SpoVT family DNA-binding domain-containing protein [Firmicutes bacterium]|nr:AbrB/MazE/SpoVT family DNA-binding domain-containing protein [Candidatus Fermentithermobacillaceae bacterium]